MGKFLLRFKLLTKERYGTDQLGFALVAVFIVLIILRIFIGKISVLAILARIIGVTAWLILAFAVLRMLSSNIDRRRRENESFLNLLHRSGERMSDMQFGSGGVNPGFTANQSTPPDKKLVKCPNCKASLRVPKQKGKHNVRCPRCGNLFEVKIR